MATSRIAVSCDSPDSPEWMRNLVVGSRGGVGGQADARVTQGRTGLRLRRLAGSLLGSGDGADAMYALSTERDGARVARYKARVCKAWHSVSLHEPQVIIE